MGSDQGHPDPICAARSSQATSRNTTSAATADTLTVERILSCVEALPAPLKLASTRLVGPGHFLRFDRVKVLLAHPDDWSKVLYRLGGFIGPVIDLGDLRPPLRDMWVDRRSRSQAGRIIEAILPHLLADTETRDRIVEAWQRSTGNAEPAAAGNSENRPNQNNGREALKDPG